MLASNPRKYMATLAVECTTGKFKENRDKSFQSRDWITVFQVAFLCACSPSNPTVWDAFPPPTPWRHWTRQTCLGKSASVAARPETKATCPSDSIFQSDCNIQPWIQMTNDYTRWFQMMKRIAPSLTTVLQVLEIFLIKRYFFSYQWYLECSFKNFNVSESW